ncbi:MAG: hypothetical protein KFH87_09830 [Bacteroidetes bacterium]|nr:hypothetical protein [Bacteroidota bacterium]
MMNRYILPVIAMLALLLGSNACDFSTANIKRATMAYEVDPGTKEPITETTRFHGSDATLHCAVLMANTPSDTKVKAVWFAEIDGTREIIDTTEITLDESGWIDFTLTLTQSSLPYADYGVDLSINGEYSQTVPFTIEPSFAEGIIKEAVIARTLSDAYFPVESGNTIPAGIANVYAPIYVSGQDRETLFSAVWYQHLDDGDRVEITSADIAFDEEGWIGFSLNLPEGIPVGSYSVDLLVNNNVEHTLEFTAE